MAVNSEVLKFFTEGVQAWQAGNIEAARTSFKWCTHLDNKATDAWRGLAATEGDMDAPATPAQIEELWESRSGFGQLLVAMGMPPETIVGKFDTGLWGLEHKMSTKSDVALSQGLTLLKEGDWDRAERALKEASPSVPWTSVAQAALHYRTQRWGDVIRHCGDVTSAVMVDNKDLPVPDSKPDHLVRGVASLMAGEALCHLERYAAAQKRLHDAMALNVPEIAGYAYYIAGLAARADGDSREAERWLNEAQARINSLTIQEAVEDKNFVLYTTSEEMIEQRTDKWDRSTEPVLAEVRAEKNEASRADLLVEAHEELNSFIGMQPVKNQIRMLEAKTKTLRAREARGLASKKINQHILFTGPPGTGKTTIARVVGKLYAGLGVIPEDKVVETSRADFIGDVVGSTAIKTKKVIAKAMGGVLFIDEAYSLVQEGGQGQKDIFGKEAIDTIVAEMENNRDNLVVIMAGYNIDMERLLSTNEGLKSRFSRKIEFHSYTADEIWEIMKQMANKREAILEPEIEHMLKEQVTEILMTRNHDGKTLLDLAGNGRFVRNVIEGAEEYRDLRVMDVAESRGETVDDLTNEELMTITVGDVDNILDRILKEYL